MKTKTSTAILTILAGTIFSFLIYAQFETHPLLQRLHVAPLLDNLLSSSSDTDDDDLNTTSAYDRFRFGDIVNATDAGYDNGLTVVTAYFNLGSFKKGGPSIIFTHDLYRQWMAIFSCIESPLIAFVDDDDDFELFVKLRSGLPPNLTKIVRIRRNEMWSFELRRRITKIFKQWGYPHHHPNTIHPGYSMAMHAKYEVMQRSIRENPFQTKYFSWLDIGLFRNIAQSCSKFRMSLPLNFSPDSVAYTQVNPRNTNLTPKDIVYKNEVWLCGAYFVGERKILYRWTQEYMNGTMALLAMNLMSTDQQVVYAMFNTMKPQTKIQAYIGDGRFNQWFHLGYISATF